MGVWIAEAPPLMRFVLHKTKVWMFGFGFLLRVALVMMMYGVVIASISPIQIFSL